MNIKHGRYLKKDIDIAKRYILELGRQEELTNLVASGKMHPRYQRKF